MKIITFLVCLLLVSNHLSSQEWKIISTNSIQKENPISYNDNIEMAGKKVAGIIHYAVDSLGILQVEREIIFPQLRIHIGEHESKWRKYRAYLKEVWKDDVVPKIYINNRLWKSGAVADIQIDGTLKINHHPSESGLRLERTFYPSTEQRLFIEQWKLTNENDGPVELKFGEVELEKVCHGNNGECRYGISVDVPDDMISLRGGMSLDITIRFWANSKDEVRPSAKQEEEKRAQFLNQVHSNLILSTPDESLNTLFAFSKVRAAESIFDSKMGLVHSPGGGRYYAGVWANDQAEYSGPFFPYLGLKDGNIAALNAYKKFYAQMDTIPNHDQNLWSSFEMNGELTCCGGDRGDAAMIAFGGLHYLMALGDIDLAKEYEPMIDWCLQYNHKKLNDEGVVLSDTDEMESRIETGNANLSTSALYYGALDLATDYYKTLGKSANKIEELEQRKVALGEAIEAYFGATVEGLETYKYYKEHQNLRHWICLPLVVGIHNRVDATVEALFERLWTENGVHVEKNSTNPEISKIFWDRGTLYALRGTFIAGEIDRSLERLTEFTQKRLLGDRVPYVVEAFPEGSMAHLSAESALYCRVFIEGVFGIKPTGINSFEMTPRLPKNWNTMSLHKIHAFGVEHNIEVKRVSDRLQVVVTSPEKEIKKIVELNDGETISISL